MKLLARGVSLVVGGILYFVGYASIRGMRAEAPGELRDAYLATGEALQIAGALLIFLIWFQWRRTALTAPDWSKYRSQLASVFVLLGILTIGILYAMLHLVVFSEAGAGPSMIKNILLSRFDSVGATIAVVLGATSIATGVGLYFDKGWARVMAKLLALPYSAGWPVGLGVAIYTWWVVNPNRSERLEGQETNHAAPRLELEHGSRETFRGELIAKDSCPGEPLPPSSRHLEKAALIAGTLGIVMLILLALLGRASQQNETEGTPQQRTEGETPQLSWPELQGIDLVPTQRYSPIPGSQPSSDVGYEEGKGVSSPPLDETSPGVSKLPGTKNALPIDELWDDTPLPASGLTPATMDASRLKISDIRQPHAYYSPETFEIAVSNPGTETVRELTVGFFREAAGPGSCSGDLKRYDGFKKFRVYLPPGDSVTLEAKFSALAKSFCIISAR